MASQTPFFFLAEMKTVISNNLLRRHIHISYDDFFKDPSFSNQNQGHEFFYKK